MSTYQIEAVHVWIRIGEAAGVGSTPGRATESGHFRVFGKTLFDTFFDFCFVDVVVTEKGVRLRRENLNSTLRRKYRVGNKL